MPHIFESYAELDRNFDGLSRALDVLRISVKHRVRHKCSHYDYRTDISSITLPKNNGYIGFEVELKQDFSLKTNSRLKSTDSLFVSILRLSKSCVTSSLLRLFAHLFTNKCHIFVTPDFLSAMNAHRIQN